MTGYDEPASPDPPPGRGGWLALPFLAAKAVLTQSVAVNVCLGASVLTTAAVLVVRAQKRAGESTTDLQRNNSAYILELEQRILALDGEADRIRAEVDSRVEVRIIKLHRLPCTETHASQQRHLMGRLCLQAARAKVVKKAQVKIDEMTKVIKELRRKLESSGGNHAETEASLNDAVTAAVAQANARTKAAVATAVAEATTAVQASAAAELAHLRQELERVADARSQLQR
jgi:hypothetical protein